MSSVDNGGSIAIKGFNYQKASIILVMIHNFNKENFKVIPESREDFEVHLEERTYFIQVKGTKRLSLNNLKSRSKGKASIIEKNLYPGDNEDIRKIFLWDIVDSTKKELVYKRGALITDKYSFSDEQKTKIIDDLSLKSEEIRKMNDQYLFITPFTNDLSGALTYLKGEMVNENLLINNERANVVMGELVLEIDQKSEIVVTSNSDLDRKKIDNVYLKKVFLKVQEMELFNEILKNMSINTLMKERVKKEKLRIPFLYQSIKDKMIENGDMKSLIYMSDEDAINEIRKSLVVIAPEINTPEQSIAIAIDCFCELER